MFSMAVLAAMTTIAMEMVAKVAGAFWGSALLGKLLVAGQAVGRELQ
ncbi:hypothetical protein [Stenotrophomonas maltophilia]